MGSAPLPLSLLALGLAGTVLAPGCGAAQGWLAHKLLHDLFTNYSSALRPAEDTERALNVTLQITLSQIIDMVSAVPRDPTAPTAPPGTPK
ncbi:hypothetical protein ASZ78_014774 [Callipepla squamata]|uniref:Neurotransmitter-gated ion-channel ligand-binding domain-containing protein n=1 Tax=Callipepla squamata TaxID=9009 RepID=A0A226MD42_CALSU|nr:hypothetical protein ASZ78_014774 [Callipepla squamata]